MKAHILVLLISCICSAVGLDSRWKLIWSDEFNGTEVDTSKWNVVSSEGLSGNGEKEWYLPEQVYVQDGNLVLRSDNISYVTAYPYRSGEVNSNGHFGGTFGRYEVHAKLPSGKGMWPAHWLLSEYLCWPVGTEFDILETIGDGHNIYGTVHFAEQCYVGLANGTVYKAPFEYGNDYHTYAIEWNTTSMAWFVDDVNYETVYFDSVYKGQPFKIDTSPHYWILNTAVGGYWPGDPDATTVFPQYHLIDYVRVYGWEPCVAGCGSGCCYEPLEICICDENYEGTNCEYIASGKQPGTKANCNVAPTPAPTPGPTSAPTPFPCPVPSTPTFTRDFTIAFDPSVDSYGNGTSGPTFETPANAAISNGQLQLMVSAKGCPEACNGQNYTGASYSTVGAFASGTFTIKFKASNVPGTGVMLWLSGWSSALGWNAYQFAIGGNTPNSMSMQFWYPGGNSWAGDVTLPFDASADFHEYSFQYHPDDISSLYADGTLIATLAPGPETDMSLKLEYYANPQYWGAYTSTTPTYVYAESVSWSTNCGTNAHRVSISQ